MTKKERFNKNTQIVERLIRRYMNDDPATWESTTKRQASNAIVVHEDAAGEVTVVRIHELLVWLLDACESIGLVEQLLTEKPFVELCTAYNFSKVVSTRWLVKKLARGYRATSLHENIVLDVTITDRVTSIEQSAKQERRRQTQRSSRLLAKLASRRQHLQQQVS